MDRHKERANRFLNDEIKKQFGISLALPQGSKVVWRKQNFYRIELPNSAKPIEFVGTGSTDPGLIFRGIMVYQYNYEDTTQLTFEALTSAETDGRPYRLIVRRSRETINSLGRRLPGLVRRGYNPCFMHPDDMSAADLVPGALVEITSDHGSVGAIVQPDATLRHGVLSMTHGFGGEPGLEEDPLRFGTNPTRLLSLKKELQPISLMPLMTAVPVTLAPVQPG